MEEPVRVGIVGSRKFVNARLIYQYVQSLPQDTVIVSGGAVGVDYFAVKAAGMYGLARKVFPPDYKQYGKRATYVRNQQIVDDVDRLVAFWDGASPGTKMTIGLAERAGKPVKIILDDPEANIED